MQSEKLERLIELTRAAGNRIMQIYKTDIAVVQKKDLSPLTEADRISHHTICDGLKELYPNIPVLSEEGKTISYGVRSEWKRFWLVDPLDGTKEFINKNDEFTVNIALIEDGYPVLGIVHVPVTGLTYVGTKGEAYVVAPDNRKQQIRVAQPPGGKITLIESRSHASDEMETYLIKLKRQYADIHTVKKGSSLKLCAVAEGTADLYPRLGPTMEWDIAAGQAVVEGACLR